MDPLRSAKRTVTCLRSPSSAAFEVRIFSTRCLGVYDSGAGRDAERGFSGTEAPHLLQNLDPAGSETPQDAQVKTKRAPHARQKFDSEGVGVLATRTRHAGRPPSAHAGRNRVARA